MGNKILLSYVVIDFLFAVTGAIVLGFSVIARNGMFDAPEDGEHAIRNLIYQQFPMEAGIANGVFILATFALSIPGIIMPTRGWLKTSGYMVAACALFTLCIGVFLWVMTLTTRQDFAQPYMTAGAQTQSLLQTAFQCCGYFNSTSPAFVTDSTCSSPAAAALQLPCATPISSFANIFIDNIFTGVFGMVGIDALLILANACLLKERKERERFRHIDEKSGQRF